MGWANCGEDSKGRPIGYGHDATCDHPGCREEIHRGLAHACGGTHGEDEFSCERYFCQKHVTHSAADMDGVHGPVCFECADLWDAEHPETDDPALTPSPAQGPLPHGDDHG